MKPRTKQIVFAIVFLPLLGLGQQQYPESEAPNNMAQGVYYQTGPGSNNTLGWTYPYGTKLTVMGSEHRNFELTATHYPYGELKVRQWDPTNDIWTSWRGIPTQDENGSYRVRGSFRVGNPGDTREDAFFLVSRGSEGKDRALVSFGDDADYKWHKGMLYGGGWPTPDFFISTKREFRTGGVIIHEPEFTITTAGDVGIGMRVPDAKLAVNGDIHAQEVKVDLLGWPDYVFDPGYSLLSLNDLERHIKEKGHLPNILSAKEVEENGIALGEMNKLLLEKIEELTLYTIKQQKQIENSAKHTQLLQKKMEQLEKEILELKNQYP